MISFQISDFTMQNYFFNKTSWLKLSSHLSFEVRRDEDVHRQAEEGEHEDGAGEVEVQERREEPGNQRRKRRCCVDVSI